MLKKVLSLIGMLLLCIILATTKTAEAAAPPVTIAVVFENGQSTITIPQVGTNFTVSINIANAPQAPEGIGFFDMGIQWDPTVLELKTGTPSADVVEGGFMKAFGSTVFPGPSVAGTNLTEGIMSDIPCGFLSGGPAHGNGTLFTVAFRAKATSAATSITIMSPNTTSYLLNATLDGVVNIDAVEDGSIIVIPEFPASALLPLFLVTTTIAVGAATFLSRKRRIPHCMP